MAALVCCTLTARCDGSFDTAPSSVVRALGLEALDVVASADTGSGANWLEVTPDGSHLVVSAREPAHKQVRIAADPAADGDLVGPAEQFTPDMASAVDSLDRLADLSFDRTRCHHGGYVETGAERLGVRAESLR